MYENPSSYRARKYKDWLLRRANYRCERCGDSKYKLHIHHIIPRKDGGKHTPENLIVLCPSCHQYAEWLYNNGFEVSREILMMC
ncbi:hypothetical protein DRP05_11675 [Archaeoglobales archaeon]|nr:MAG: hypothetical protein DRP05_11675 [Archaeoglobales archaeon]